MSGGSRLHEEDGSDKITFRLPSHLKEDYKEQVDNMSADLEEYVRRQVEQPTDRDGIEPYADPDERDLSIAYRLLCERRNYAGIVRGTAAKRLLAQAIDHVSQDDAMRVLKRLEQRGYLHLQNEAPPSERVSIHVRPFSRQAAAKRATKRGESPANV